MTGVELPQVSLQRYLDLVRRRRWQLVPVSVFGLLVGALIAFLIPRFYVADTLIERREVPGEFPRDVEDPTRAIVQAAQLMLPVKVGAALERLKWPEWVAGDASDRTQIEKDVRSRIGINDTNALDRAREYVLIRVAYRDQNAARAADFANALVQTWIEESLAQMRKDHEDQRQRANVEHGNWSERFDRLLAEERDIRRRFHMRADLDPSVANAEEQRRGEELRKDTDALMTKQFDRATLADSVKLDEEKLRKMPERIPLSESSVTEWAQVLVTAQLRPPLVLELVKQWSALKEGHARIPAGTIGQRRSEARLQAAQTRLVMLLEIPLDAKGEMPNREFVALAAKLVEDRAKLARLGAEIERLAQRLAEQQADQEQLPEGRRQLKDCLAKQARADSEIRKQFDLLQAQEGILRALDARKPMQQVQPAKPPPHPTDPNIFVVALVGAVLGLGVAIGLILLLDLLQGSFKTPEDVERGLGVPVLGGLSHLETEEERTTVARGRRRAAVAAFAFVALVVVVVTFYYVAPSRLPGMVRDLLRGLLGS